MAMRVQYVNCSRCLPLLTRINARGSRLADVSELANVHSLQWLVLSDVEGVKGIESLQQARVCRFEGNECGCRYSEIASNDL